MCLIFPNIVWFIRVIPPNGLCENSLLMLVWWSQLTLINDVWQSFLVNICWHIGFFGFVHSSSHWLVYWCEMNVFVAVRAPFKWFLGCWFFEVIGIIFRTHNAKNDPVFDFGMASLIKAYYTSRFKTQLESSSSWFAFQFPLFHW